MKKAKTNCPNCGAVMTSDSCSFCGTIVYDFACLDTDEPFFIKIKCGNRIHRLKVMLTEVSHTSRTCDEYCDPYEYKYLVRTSRLIEDLSLNFKILPYTAYDQQILAMTIDTDEINPDERPY